MRWKIGLVVIIGLMWGAVIIDNLLGNRKSLKVAAFNDLEIREIVCFNSLGDIIWISTEEELGKHILPSPNPESPTKIIEILYDSNNHFFVFCEYNHLEKSLTNIGPARNVKCCSDYLNGAVLRYVQSLSASAGGFFVGSFLINF